MQNFRKYLELIAWNGGLVLLAFMDPGTDAHYSFCFFKFIGIKYCPGCGLGHSISYLFHGNLRASFDAHPLGFFAVSVIFARIYKLYSLHIFPHFKKYYYGQQF
jgi:hypothetical protein